MLLTYILYLATVLFDEAPNLAHESKALNSAQVLETDAGSPADCPIIIIETNCDDY